MLCMQSKPCITHVMPRMRNMCVHGARMGAGEAMHQKALPRRGFKGPWGALWGSWMGGRWRLMLLVLERCSMSFPMGPHSHWQPLRGCQWHDIPPPRVVNGQSLQGKSCVGTYPKASTVHWYAHSTNTMHITHITHMTHSLHITSSIHTTLVCAVYILQTHHGYNVYNALNACAVHAECAMYNTRNAHNAEHVCARCMKAGRRGNAPKGSPQEGLEKPLGYPLGVLDGRSLEANVGKVFDELPNGAPQPSAHAPRLPMAPYAPPQGLSMGNCCRGSPALAHTP